MSEKQIKIDQVPITWFDRLIGFFSPSAQFRRVRSRVNLDMQLRGYKAAKTFKLDDWTSANSGGPNSETKPALKKIRDRARDLIRNDEYAENGLNEIINQTIGWGIEAKIEGRNKSTTKALNEAWKEWALTSLCDYNRQDNFYGLQIQALRTIVESGEVLSYKHTEDDTNSIQLLEPDLLDESQDDETKGFIQGIEFKQGKRIAYYIYEKHPGDSLRTPVKRIDAKFIDHVYKKERIGQQRGVSWFKSGIETLANLSEYERATLIKQKASACFMAFVTQPDSDIGLNSTQVEEKRQQEFTLEPALVRYLNEGEEVQFANPPTVNDTDLSSKYLRRLAKGLGLTYEALTGDYSRVNFSSGRMGHLSMRRNIRTWQWIMMIPNFCNPCFDHFLEWAKVSKGIDVNGANVTWTPPAFESIDPLKEAQANEKNINLGIKSRSECIREQGYDVIEHFEEISEEQKLIEELGIELGQSTQSNEVTNSEETKGDEESTN